MVLGFCPGFRQGSINGPVASMIALVARPRLDWDAAHAIECAGEPEDPSDLNFPAVVGVRRAALSRLYGLGFGTVTIISAV